jgi:subfamily B ATP-binding cassette protein HlyB/CyaB
MSSTAAACPVECAPEPATHHDGGQAHPSELPASTFVWLVGSLCSVHGLAFDERLLLQRFAPPYDLSQLLAALGELGARTRLAPQWSADDLPAVAFLRLPPSASSQPGSPSDHAAAVPSVTPVLVVKTTAQEVVFFRAMDSIASVMPAAAFAAARIGQVLLVQPAVPAARDPDVEATGASAFGFRWFVPEILKHKRIWRDVLLASLVIQLLALGLPLMTQAIIDKVVVHRTESTLIALGAGLAVFMLFSAALTWVRQYLVLHTGTRIDAVLGAHVFKHLVELPPRYFQHRPTGVIAARLHGVEQIRDFLSSAAVSLILDLPFLSICLAIMFVYSVPLTLVALGILGAIVIASLVVSPVFQARLNQEFLLGARNQAFLTEYVAGMDTVKSLQMEPILQRRYGDYLASHLRASFATKQVGNAYNVVAGTLEQAMTLVILVVGAWIVMQPPASSADVFTIGMLVAFQMFAGKLSQPIMRLVGLWQQFQQARLAVARLGDLMDAPTEPYGVTPARAGAGRGTAAGQSEPSAQPVIDIQSLAFRYGDDRPFLYEDLDLQVREGECVALMGPSGSGKSTLARLLQGFYQPTRGRILVEGVDARHLTANELRATFGVVPQETVLFSGTILDNLLLANPLASFDDAVTACRMAEIHEVIEQLPKGYQTEIGERGAGLSGGQRQRIAIARALLKQPRVLLFDEATSNLDAQTAEAFAKTIESLRGKVTILFITHARVGALKFDRVVTLGAAPTPPAHLHLARTEEVR